MKHCSLNMTKACIAGFKSFTAIRRFDAELAYKPVIARSVKIAASKVEQESLSADLNPANESCAADLNHQDDSQLTGFNHNNSQTSDLNLADESQNAGTNRGDESMPDKSTPVVTNLLNIDNESHAADMNLQCDSQTAGLNVDNGSKSPSSATLEQQQNDIPSLGRNAEICDGEKSSNCDESTVCADDKLMKAANADDQPLNLGTSRDKYSVLFHQSEGSASSSVRLLSGAGGPACHVELPEGDQMNDL